MARVKVDINPLQRLKQIFKDPRVFERIGRFTVRNNKELVRTGLSPATEKDIPALRTNTIKLKAIRAQFNKTSKFYIPGLSNLTFSGQLLNAMTFELVRKPIGFNVEIFIKDTPHRNPKGTRKDAPRKTNAQIAAEIEKGNSSNNQVPRPFIGIDAKATEQIRKILIQHLKKQLRRTNR